MAKRNWSTLTWFLAAPTTCAYSEETVDRQKLSEAILSILTVADPLGLISERVENLDEYEAEAGRIAARIQECQSERSCRRLVYEVFVEQFDEESVTPEESFSDIASAIWRLVRENV